MGGANEIATSVGGEMAQLLDVMVECWKNAPQSRLTALNVKKKINKMLNEF